MLDHGRIKHKGLKRLARDGDERGIQKEWIPRARRILAALDAATSPGELDLPGWRWHEMKGNRKGTYSVLVTGNWRITFEWDDRGPKNVRLEDYHGR